MKRPLLAGAALGVLAFLAPQVALADCEARLAEAAAAVGTLPNGTDYRVQDQLNEFYSEAEGLMETDQAGCLSAVQRMEDLVRRNGGSVGAKGESGLMQTADKGDGAGGGAAFQPASTGGNGGSGRQGFVPINPTSSGDMESRMAALGPERQREVRAADNYARATHAMGSSIVDSAATPSEGVNRLAVATNQAIEMAEAARDAMLVDRSRFSTMVQNLLERFAESKQAFEAAMNSPQVQAALASATDAQINSIRAAYIEAAQGTGVLDQRAREIESANISDGMAPGFEAAYRAMARRHQNELLGPTETVEVKKEQYFGTVAAMDQGRANLAYGELQAANNRVIVIRKRQNDEYDALLREYSTMVIDLTQPDGRPRTEGGRPPVAGGGQGGTNPPTQRPGETASERADREQLEAERARLTEQINRERERREAEERRADSLRRMSELNQEAASLRDAIARGDNSPATRERLEAVRREMNQTISDARTRRTREGAPQDYYTRSGNISDWDMQCFECSQPYVAPSGTESPMRDGARPTNPQYGPEHRPDQVNGPPKDELLFPLSPEGQRQARAAEAAAAAARARAEREAADVPNQTRGDATSRPNSQREGDNPQPETSTPGEVSTPSPEQTYTPAGAASRKPKSIGDYWAKKNFARESS